MRSSSRYLLPGVAIVAGLVGLVWGWIGLNAAIHGGGMFAVLLIVFGFGGIVLSLALWRTWRTISRPRS